MIKSTTPPPVRIGIIGGGLMGREVASVFGRWFALEGFPVPAEVTAVCDLNADLLDWFRRIPTVRLLTANYADLITSGDVDVIYVALPHHLHERVYLDVLREGKGSPGGETLWHRPGRGAAGSR